MFALNISGNLAKNQRKEHVLLPLFIMLIMAGEQVYNQHLHMN